MTSRPRPVEQDSRGILDPGLMRARVRLTRYPVGPELSGIIDRFWAVRWDLPVDLTHNQQVVTHPSANFSVGHTGADARGYRADIIEARCYGVATRMTTRVLTGRGWTVAAMTTSGGLGALTTAPAATFTDRVVGLQEAIQVDEPDLIRRITAEPDEPARVALLADALASALQPDRMRTARTVAETAHLVESDRTIRTLADLSARTGVGPRSLQRMFREYAGASPTWVLRRYRLLDVAEAVRNGLPVTWSDVAANLGYADQAHLIRDFRAATGRTPAAYAQAQSAQV